MAYKLKKKLAARKNYGVKRSLNSIKYIVIHYTANDGDTDENNGKYFANNVVYASAHYFVDSDSITQSVPDDYVAYSVGGSKYGNCATTGGGTLYGKATNSNTLSIELCDDVKNGKIYPSAKTIENAIAFTKAKMKEYGIPASRVIRHFDVNGKGCPAYWCGTTAKNNKWKTEFLNKLSNGTGTTTSNSTSNTAKKDTFKSYTVLITACSLNVRAGAGTKYKVTTTVKKGYKYTIVEEKTVSGSKWGKLKSGAGWINLNYTKKVS